MNDTQDNKVEPKTADTAEVKKADEAVKDTAYKAEPKTAN